MLILGITGGIGTGKSTVLKTLSELGFPVISADMIARDLLVPGTPLCTAVVAEFPEAGVISETGVKAVERRALAARIFSDDEARSRLNALMHPPISERLKTFYEKWRDEVGLAAAAEIPLLFENSLEFLVDKTVTVSCEPETQLLRIMDRQHISREDAQRWLSAQWPLEKKVQMSDYVLHNNGTLGELKTKVKEFCRDLTAYSN